MPDNTAPSASSEQTLPNVSHLDWLTDEDTDVLAVRRELAAASVAGLDNFWDNEEDLAWQDFQTTGGKWAHYDRHDSRDRR